MRTFKSHTNEGRVTPALVKGLGFMLRNKLSQKIKSGKASKDLSQKLDALLDWSSPQKVVHLLVWEINPIRNMKGGLKWLRKDTNPKKS